MATIMLKLEKKFPTHIGFAEVICRNTDTRAMLVLYKMYACTICQQIPSLMTRRLLYASLPPNKASHVSMC